MSTTGQQQLHAPNAKRADDLDEQPRSAMTALQETFDLPRDDHGIYARIPIPTQAAYMKASLGTQRRTSSLLGRQGLNGRVAAERIVVDFDAVLPDAPA